MIFERIILGTVHGGYIAMKRNLKFWMVLVAVLLVGSVCANALAEGQYANKLSVSTEDWRDWEISPSFSHVLLGDDGELIIGPGAGLGHGMVILSPEGEDLKLRNFRISFDLKTDEHTGYWDRLGLQVRKPTKENLYLDGGYWISLGNVVGCIEIPPEHSFRSIDVVDGYGIDFESDYHRVVVEVKDGTISVTIDGQEIGYMSIWDAYSLYLDEGYISFFAHNSEVRIKNVLLEY